VCVSLSLLTTHRGELGRQVQGDKHDEVKARVKLRLGGARRWR
jgi:hypothetical protein